jgi:hypothetical protein
MLAALKSAGYKKFEMSITLIQPAFISLNTDNTGPYSSLVSLLIVYTKGEERSVMRFLWSDGS